MSSHDYPSQTVFVEAASVGRPRKFPAGDQIFKEGSEANCLYLLKEGAVKLSTALDPERRFEIGTCSAGEVFGLELLTHSPRSTDAIASTSTTCLELSESAVHRLLIRGQEFASALARSSALVFTTLAARAKSLAYADEYGRLRQYLMQASTQSTSTWTSARRPTHREVSEQLGVSLKRLSRILTELKRAGFLEPTDNGYRLLKSLPECY